MPAKKFRFRKVLYELVCGAWENAAVNIEQRIQKLSQDEYNAIETLALT